MTQVLPKHKERYSIGIDIGTHSVKIVRLEHAKDRMELSDYFIEPMQLELSGALKKAAALFHEQKKIALSVSGPATIIRYVPFPTMKEDELKHAMKFEAQKHITFPVAEAMIDGCILKTGLPDNKMLVLLAAVKQDMLRQRIKMVEEAGLKPHVVDMDALALVNAFEMNLSPGTAAQTAPVVLLHIGASLSSVNVVENGVPLLSRDVRIAGNNFTEKIADALSIDSKQAELTKMDIPKDKLPQIQAALESVWSQLATELRMSFDYYESQNAANVGCIYLSGGGSLLSMGKEILENILGMKVEYWDPLKIMTIGKSVDQQKLRIQAPQLAVAIGLAMRPAS
jgi:type IV pilus assembly protein PilM